jgi:hypothetical protein
MSKIILYDLENRQIKILVSYIDKLVPIKNHAYFPELKTQIILNPNSIICSGRSNWIYVKETPEQIKSFIARANKILGEN